MQGPFSVTRSILTYHLHKAQGEGVAIENLCAACTSDYPDWFQKQGPLAEIRSIKILINRYSGTEHANFRAVEPAG